MSVVPPPTSVAVLEDSVAWTLGCLEAARDAALSSPTPCRGWTLGDLLLHMEDSLAALGDAAEQGRVPIEGSRGAGDSGDLVDRIVERGCATLAAWRRRLTSAPVTVGELVLGRDTTVLVGALEIAVHGWDVAAACGDHRPLPADLAERLHALALVVVTPRERGHRFAAPVEVAPRASASARLLAHLGRDPAWSAPRSGGG